MTSKEKYFADSYFNSDCFTIWQAYARPSYAKESAFCSIRNEMYARSGYDIRITGHNTSTFTCGYRFILDDNEYLRIHTAYRHFDIKLSI